MDKPGTVKQIEDLCRKYFPLIENYAYVRLLRNPNDRGDFISEITTWLLEKSPEMRAIAEKNPSDKRIIERVVFDCSVKMGEKSKRVDFVWGEFSLK